MQEDAEVIRGLHDYDTGIVDAASMYFRAGEPVAFILACEQLKQPMQRLYNPWLLIHQKKPQLLEDYYRCTTVFACRH